MGVTTALEWLSSCSGCEIAILNIGEDLVELLTDHLDIVHGPVIMDHKYFGQCGDEGSRLEIPEAVVGIAHARILADHTAGPDADPVMSDEMNAADRARAASPFFERGKPSSTVAWLAVVYDRFYA